MLVLTVALAGVHGSASAAFPGQNGKIAFSSSADGDFEIYSVSPDGSGLLKLTDNTVADHTPSWSPDGQQIVFMRGPFGDRDVWKMNADGSGQTLLDIGENPTWSPDGQRIAYSRAGPCSADGGLWTMAPDGTDKTHLICGGFLGRLSWSPDGTEIAFQMLGDIFKANADGTGIQNLTNAESANTNLRASWSPDGSKIAFDSDRDHRGFSTGIEDIFVMNGDGSMETRIGAHAAHDQHPSWSPDGSKIAFWSDRSPAGVYVMNPDGTSPIFLTEGIEPDWQPIPINSYPRPKGATPFYGSLAIAYEPCTAGQNPRPAARLRLVLGPPDDLRLPHGRHG